MREIERILCVHEHIRYPLPSWGPVFWVLLESSEVDLEFGSLWIPWSSDPIRLLKHHLVLVVAIISRPFCKDTFVRIYRLFVHQTGQVRKLQCALSYTIWWMMKQIIILLLRQGSNRIPGCDPILKNKDRLSNDEYASICNRTFHTLSFIVAILHFTVLLIN
jgi:hypothetical protein